MEPKLNMTDGPIQGWGVRVVMFNGTFNNISILLVEKTTNLLQVADKLVLLKVIVSLIDQNLR
jgi:hypothetical protein